MLRTKDASGEDPESLYEVPFYFDLSKLVSMRELEEEDIPIEYIRKTAIMLSGDPTEYYVKASISSILKLLGGGDGIHVTELPNDTPVLPAIKIHL